MPELIENVIMDRQILFGILMGASHPVLVLDEKLLIISITQKAQKVLGYEEEELIGQKVQYFIDETYHNNLNAILSSLLKKENVELQFNFDCKAITKRGSIIPLTLSINKINHEDDLRIIIIVSDLSATIKSAQTQKEAFQLFSKLADHSPGLVVLQDEENNIIYSNTLFQEYLGYKKGENFKMKFTDFVHPDDILKLNNDNEIVRILSKDNQYKIFNITRFKHFDPEENKLYFCLIMDDITAVSEKNGGSAKIDKHPIQDSWFRVLPDVYLKLNIEGFVLEILTGN
jgi:PAS domain S-box-containing protein